uniref:Zinc carboxypeptidase A 1 n=1 Tax=Lutzomyia longipalpis TaxID=7200 RepID=A0A1B0GIS5_LUTLO
MQKIHILLISFIVLLSGLALAERFDNYHVYSLELQSLRHVELIRDFEDKLSGGVEVLSPLMRKIPQEVNVLISPNQIVDFKAILRAQKIPFRLIEENFQDVIDEDARLNNLRADTGDYSWERYYRLENIHNWMRSLEAKHPGVVNTIVGGESYEKRKILGVRIAHNEKNPAIFVEGGIHAREWISPATSTFIANELLTSEDPETKRLAQSYTWYIFPSVNPDGYEFSATANRMWRKTRQPYGFCYGADPNRNWDHHWMEEGSSSFSCSQVYAGSAPFSEIETRTLSQYISSVKNLRLYVSLHSYSQLLLYPYGTSEKVTKPQDYDRISNATVRAISKRYGTTYEYGNIEEAIYPASGGSIDWVHGVNKVPLAFTFELRPDRNSRNGFMLPADQIIPTGEETMDGLTAMRYDNYRVYRMSVNSSDELDVFQSLENNCRMGIIVERHPVRGKAQVIVSPNKTLSFEALMREKDIKIKMMESNIQRLFDEELKVLNDWTPGKSRPMNFKIYHTLTDIYEWLYDLSRKYQKHVKLLRIGKSYENREILGIEISHNRRNPTAFIEGGIHAREWISPATILYFINELLTSKEEEIVKLARKINWYIVPVVNPDGYVYTHTHDRLWRKTRRPYGMSYGVDANRNFGFHWMEKGSSLRPCSEIFAGPRPFSEPETWALATFLKNIPKLKLYISFHSFGQLFMYPYGYSPRPVKNFRDVDQIAFATATALSRRYGTHYKYGNIYNTIYPASGSSVDWVSGVRRVPLAYAYELRPARNTILGVILDPKFIEPTSFEVIDSLIAMFNFIPRFKMTISIVVLIAISCVFGHTLGEVARYDNYRIYGVTVNSVEDFKALESLEGSSDGYIFLSMPSKLSKEAAVVVAPHKFEIFESFLDSKSIKHRVTQKNLQRMIDMERRSMDFRKRRSNGFDFDNYHTIEEINAWLKSLEEAHPDVVSVITAGKSYQERDILGVKLSRGADKPGIFVEAGIHAREWISPATVIFLINELLTSSDQGVKDLAENYDWYIFPNINPDGYVYTHEKNRMWRKTLKPDPDIAACFGVDANRNWDFQWTSSETTNNPCSDKYAGPSPASEPEVIAVANYMTSIKDKLHLFLSFHSFSQLILFPNGYTEELVEHYNDLKDIGDSAAKALAQRYGTEYTVGDIYSTIYPAPGTSIDWAYGALGIKLSFVYELRPTSNLEGGHTLPADQIRPVALETIDSLVALVKRAKELKYFDRQ